MKTYNIFISHAWDYNSDYYRLVEKLNNEPYFYFKNYSVPEHDALKTKTDKELEEALYRQIAPVSAVLIIAGMYYNHRKWIQKEIEIAQFYSKPIIVIKPWGAERLPSELNNFVQVNWQINSIVNAIKTYS